MPNDTDLSLPADPVLAGMVLALRDHPGEVLVRLPEVSRDWAGVSARAGWHLNTPDDAQRLFAYMTNPVPVLSTVKSESTIRFERFYWHRHGLTVQVSRVLHPQAFDVHTLANYDE